VALILASDLLFVEQKCSTSSFLPENGNHVGVQLAPRWKSFVIFFFCLLVCGFFYTVREFLVDATYLLRKGEKSVCVLILKKSEDNISDFSRSFD